MSHTAQMVLLFIIAVPCAVMFIWAWIWYGRH